MRVFRSKKLAHEQDIAPRNISSFGGNKKITAYLVVPSEALQLSKDSGGLKVNVLLTNERGWRSKAIRLMADEIAIKSSALVIVPDLFRGRTDAILDPAQVNFTMSVAERRRIFDDVLSTICFVQKELSPQAISWIGVGIGGGIALDLATDLQTIACLGKKEEINRLMTEQERQSNSEKSSDWQGKGERNAGQWNLSAMAENELIRTYLSQSMWLRKKLLEKPVIFPSSSTAAAAAAQTSEKKQKEQRKKKTQNEIKIRRQRNSMGLDEEEEEEDEEDIEGLSEVEDLGEVSEEMILASAEDDALLEADDETFEEEIRRQVKDFYEEYMKNNRSLLSSSVASGDTSSNISISSDIGSSSSSRDSSDLRESETHSDQIPVSALASAERPLIELDLVTRRTRRVHSLFEEEKEEEESSDPAEDYSQQFVKELQWIEEKSQFALASSSSLWQTNSAIPPKELLNLLPHSLVVYDPQHFNREKMAQNLTISFLFAERIPSSLSGGQEQQEQEQEEES